MDFGASSEDDLLDSNNSLTGSEWVVTDKLPSHLVGNPYFDVSDRKDLDKKLLLRIKPPKGFSLSQAICSYGYFCLAPNRWVPGKQNGKDMDAAQKRQHWNDEGCLVRPLTIRSNTEKRSFLTKTVLVALGQNTQTSSILLSIIGGCSCLEQQQQLTDQIDRMLRLYTSIEAFHELYPETRERGFGRLYRSPTLFEDMVKTITNCNMKWGGTVEMNAKLCKKVGSNGAFPTPEEIQEVGADFLKENCRVGYRGEYIWNLANEVVDGKLDLARDLGSTPKGVCLHKRENVEKRLLQISGIGPYAANNILQLMGYFDSHPFDTETVRLWKEDFGAPKSVTKAEVFEQARAHYSRYKPYTFIAYWYDLWKNYERRAGARSPQWSIEQYEKERPTSVNSDHNSIFAHPPSNSDTNKDSKPN